MTQGRWFKRRDEREILLWKSLCLADWITPISELSSNYLRISRSASSTLLFFFNFGNSGFTTADFLDSGSRLALTKILEKSSNALPGMPFMTPNFWE